MTKSQPWVKECSPSLKVFIARHGETEWSKNGRHTGETDIDLTENGVKQAKALASRVSQIQFESVFTSPLKRAYKTCSLCGLDNRAEVTNALLEWDYGDYEGITTQEIQKNVPNWNIFTHGSKNGESIQDVAKRARSFLAKIQALEGNVILFTSGHFSRALSCSWIDQPFSLAQHFPLSTASLSILSVDRGTPTILLWNDTSHLNALISS